MFVQIIEGTTSDAEGLRRTTERWNDELRPSADGFIGGTFGITKDDIAVTIARFEDEASARANERRPEQTAFAEEMRKYFAGEPTFTDSTDVETWRGGGSDDAGFVQVMKLTGLSREQAQKMDAMFERYQDMRPDVLGGIRVWTGQDTCVEVIYFTSEAEAREGEKAPPPEGFEAEMAEFAPVMQSAGYLDLSDPILF